MTGVSDAPHLCYLMQTLAWIGGERYWPGDVVAEQLGDFDDPRVARDLEQSVRLGLLSASEAGFRLTDAGWAVAADTTSFPVSETG